MSSDSFYVWNGVGGISGPRKKYAMSNYPLVIEHPYSVVGKETGIAFTVAEHYGNYGHWAPGASITAERIGTQDQTRLHFRTKSEDRKSVV